MVEPSVFDTLKAKYHELYEAVCPKCNEVLYLYNPPTDESFDATTGEKLPYEPERENVQFAGEHGFYEEYICESCFDSLLTYGLTLIIRANNHKERWVLDDGYAVIREDDEGGFGDEGLFKTYEKQVLAIARSPKWHAIGWRGYYEFHVDETVVKPFNGGALLHGHHSEELEAAKKKAYDRALKALGIPTFEIYSGTGNIFAMNADYFTRAQDAEAAANVAKFVKAWYNADDWRWNLGVLFCQNQGTPPTKAVVEELKARGSIPKTIDWQAVAEGRIPTEG